MNFYPLRIFNPIVLTLLLSIGAKCSTSIQLSDRAQISVLTSRSGEDLYTAFGHSAIRVYDPGVNMDYVFNYGTFNFRQEGFYVNFVRGKLNYFLSIAQYPRFKKTYIRENRSLYEQVLNLNNAQKQELFDFLVENYEPDNRYYLYDFFFDNCATKIRDVFEMVLGDSLIFNYDYAQEEISFRHLLDPYVADRPWVDFGFYLILGLPSDSIAHPRDYMFLPDYVEAAFDGAQIAIGKDTIPFVRNKTTIFESAETAKNQDTRITPKIILWMLFIIVGLLSIIFAFWGKTGRFMDILIFGISGLLGCSMILFWVGTDHVVLPKNLNMLWAIPLHLPITLMLLFHKRYNWLRYYFLLTGCWMLILLVVWNLLPQDFHPVLVPFVMLLGLRSFVIYLQMRSATR